MSGHRRIKHRANKKANLMAAVSDHEDDEELEALFKSVNDQIEAEGVVKDQVNVSDVPSPTVNVSKDAEEDVVPEIVPDAEPNVEKSSSETRTEPLLEEDVTESENVLDEETEKENSDDVLITKAVSGSVASRLKRKKVHVQVAEEPSAKKKKESVKVTQKSPVKKSKKEGFAVSTRKSPRSYRNTQVEVPKKKAEGKKKGSASTSKKGKEVVISSDEDYDVEEDVQDILTPVSKKKIGGKKLPANVPSAPLDRVSFHYEENVQLWKYVYQRRIAQERELDEEALKCEEIVSILECAGLMKTVKGVGRCYDKLVKEFIVNVPKGCNKADSSDYQKVYVRGQCVTFSAAAINRYLGRNPEPVADPEVHLDDVAKEITAGQVPEWPKKGLLPAKKLSVKYAVLNRIGAVTWAPTNHTSGVTPLLAKLLYIIGTDTRFDFGNYVVEQTMKHVCTFAIRLPIAFPCLITELILDQYPDILWSDEKPAKRPPPLSFDYRLFAGQHVPDIVVPAGKAQVAAGSSKTATGSSRKDIIAELTETSNTLEGTIQALKARKHNVDQLLQALIREEGIEAEEETREDEEEGSDSDAAESST